MLRGETRPFAGTVGASEAELEPEREAPFWQATQEPTPNFFGDAEATRCS